MLDMTKLGFEQESLEIFQRNIAKPYGMVLVTGPTGSGKTNTLIFRAAVVEHIRNQYYDGGRPGRIQSAGNQSGADEGTDRA